MLTVPKTIAVGLFSAAGWKDAQSWPNEKLASKLKDVPECIDDDHEFEGDDAEALSASLDDVKSALKAEGSEAVFEIVAPAEEAAEEKPAKAKKEKTPKAEKAAEEKPAKEAAPAVRKNTWQNLTIDLLKENGIDAEITDELVEELVTRKGAFDKQALAKSWLKYIQDIVQDWNS